MNEWFIWMLFGHLFGDYVFQNDWMAYNKKKKTKEGLLACYVHCTIYTGIVGLFLLAGGIYVSFTQVTLILLSHYVLDGTHVVEWWFRVYNKNSWSTSLPTVTTAQAEYAEQPESAGTISWDTCPTAEVSVKVAFGAIVYTVVDNTLHLFMMFLVLSYV